MLNQEEIKKIIPHRDNMLLVQEAEKIDDTIRSADILSAVTSFSSKDIFRAILLFRELFSVR